MGFDIEDDSPSRYGYEFDGLVERWAVVEDEHDLQHPDRGQCGGVGACSMMAAAYDLQTRMLAELERRRKAHPVYPRDEA